MINHGKNKNVLAGNFQKTIRFAAGLFDRVEYSPLPNKRVGAYKRVGWKFSGSLINVYGQINV